MCGLQASKDYDSKEDVQKINNPSLGTEEEMILNCRKGNLD